MTRQELISAISESAAECGYAFNTGFEYRINAELKELPAAWLLPLKLIKKEGRNEGRCHYEVVLKLIHACNDHTSAGREEVWALMQEHIFEICTTLRSHNDICTLGEVNCQPVELSLTNRGELSMTASFTALTNFSNQTNCKS